MYNLITRRAHLILVLAVLTYPCRAQIDNIPHKIAVSLKESRKYVVDYNQSGPSDKYLLEVEIYNVSGLIEERRNYYRSGESAGIDTYKYNREGKVIEETFYGELNPKEYQRVTREYDNKGNIIESICETSSGIICFHLSFIYDDLSRLLSETSYITREKSNPISISRYNYDAFKNSVERITTTSSLVIKEKRIEKWYYNQNDSLSEHLITILDKDGEVRKSRKTIYRYLDELQIRETLIESLGVSKLVEKEYFDDKQRVFRRDELWEDGEIVTQEIFEYDNNGKVKVYKKYNHFEFDGDIMKKYEYNSFGDIVREDIYVNDSPFRSFFYSYEY